MISQSARFPFEDDKTLDPSLSKMCTPGHWDPTKIFRRTVPLGPAQALPTDPRPWTRICLEYVNSGPLEQAPAPPSDVIFPMGGQTYNPVPYIQNIDKESALERLGRPLTRDLPQYCNPGQYVPPSRGTLFQQQTLIPAPRFVPNDIMRSLENPAVLQNTGQYECSAQAMKCNTNFSNGLWNNSTKLEKYNQRAPPCGAMNEYAHGTYPSANNLPTGF